MANTCLICWEQILHLKQSYTECFKCKIILHNECENTYRSDRTYCKCPHCQGIGTLTCKEIKKNIKCLPNIDTILDHLQYTKFDHRVDNENMYSSLQIGMTLYYIEKNFSSNKRNWYVVDRIITDIDLINKQIGTHHPDENYKMYVGIIYYGIDHPFNLVDHYIKKSE